MDFNEHNSQSNGSTSPGATQPEEQSYDKAVGISLFVLLLLIISATTAYFISLDYGLLGTNESTSPTVIDDTPIDTSTSEGRRQLLDALAAEQSAASSDANTENATTEDRLGLLAELDSEAADEEDDETSAQTSADRLRVLEELNQAGNN